MGYKPRPESEAILSRALYWIQSVEYSVTARWVFYRLLQDGTYSEKAGYKHLLNLLSKARKEFYDEWRPWTLADDTRAPILMQRRGYYGLHLRGNGFKDEQEWRATVREEINCPLDKWITQSVYTEIWFEAAAMQGQFLHYANQYTPLLAFHGDISIPEKWRTAERLAKRHTELGRPVHIYYFGDYDAKGLTIPLSAWRDIGTWTAAILIKNGMAPGEACTVLNYHRVGINEEHIEALGLPENPEHPGTYQWEALDDDQAERLIQKSTELLDGSAFEKVESEEADITARFRERITENEQ